MENKTQKKNVTRRRILTLTVLGVLVIASLTGNSLAVYSKSIPLFGNITFLFPTATPTSTPEPTATPKPADDMTNLEWLAYMIGDDTTIYKYFASRYKKGNTLDSNGRNFAPNVWDELRGLVSKIGGNPGDAAGWRIYLDDEKNGWNIFWTTTDLSNTHPKDLLPYVWRYNSKSGSTVSGYAYVKDKTVEGYAIHQIDGGTFTAGMHPDLTPTPEPSLSPTPEPSVTPEASATPEASSTPEASVTPEVSATPEASATPEPAATPEPTAASEPAATPEPVPAPEAATATPAPDPTPNP